MKFKALKLSQLFLARNSVETLRQNGFSIPMSHRFLTSAIASDLCLVVVASAHSPGLIANRNDQKLGNMGPPI